MKKICDIVTQHHIIFLVASLIFALPFISFSPFVKTVDNVDYFILKDDPDVEFHNEFKDVFGNNEFFVVAFEKEDIFTADNLTLLKNITEELETINEVREVKSLANVDDTIGGPDYFEVRKFLEDIPEDNSKLERLKRQAINNPLYVKNLISPDARTAAILVYLYDRPDDRNYRKRLIVQTQRILDQYRNEFDQFYLAGRPITSFSLSQYMATDAATFVPITYLLITIVIWLFFRNLRLTLLAVANISMCMGATMGLFAITGITLNNVTTIVPPLVMALALCDTVHISHMEKRVLSQFPDKREALSSVLNKVVTPCFLTTVTTAIGFLSLSISEIPPIKEFAYIASAGMVFEFIFSFFFLPPLILFFAPEKIYKDYAKQRVMTSFLGKINNFVQKQYKSIALLSLVLFLAPAGLQVK